VRESDSIVEEKIQLDDLANNDLFLKFQNVFFDNIDYIFFFFSVGAISFFCFYKIAIILSNTNIDINQQNILINLVDQANDEPNEVMDVPAVNIDDAPTLKLDADEDKLELFEYFYEIAREIARIFI
jgi:hypothetical protein